MGMYSDRKPLRDTPWAVNRQPAKDGTSAEYRTRQEIQNKFNKCCINVTHLDETSRMSAGFVFRYGTKCMGGLILPILVLLHL